jgi:hypothetical protein
MPSLKTNRWIVQIGSASTLMQPIGSCHVTRSHLQYEASLKWDLAQLFLAFYYGHKSRERQTALVSCTLHITSPQFFTTFVQFVLYSASWYVDFFFSLVWYELYELYILFYNVREKYISLKKSMSLFFVFYVFLTSW